MFADFSEVKVPGTRTSVIRGIIIINNHPLHTRLARAAHIVKGSLLLSFYQITHVGLIDMIIEDLSAFLENCALFFISQTFFLPYLACKVLVLLHQHANAVLPDSFWAFCKAYMGISVHKMRIKTTQTRKCPLSASTTCTNTLKNASKKLLVLYKPRLLGRNISVQVYLHCSQKNTVSIYSKTSGNLPAKSVLKSAILTSASGLVWDLLILSILAFKVSKSLAHSSCVLLALGTFARRFLFISRSK